MLVVNLYGGPGTGKSTTAAGLFYKLKSAGISTELVTEVAKDKTWEGNHYHLAQQDLIFAEQHLRISRVYDKVDVVITDSPLLLSCIYCPEEYPSSFKAFVQDINKQYNSLDVFLKRDKPYVQVGRSQTEEEAREIDERILEEMDADVVVTANEFCVDKLVGFILRELGG